MQRKLYFMANRYARQNDRRHNWGKFVRFLACIVVFCTTYALILPAITMEKSVCKIEEHSHHETCYQKTVQEPTVSIVCTYESLGVHTHTEGCYDAESNLQCGMADFLVHIHEDSCADASGALLCRLPEIAEHIHTAGCYETVMPATEESHVHEDSCYIMTRGELTCQLAETEGHSHADACFTRGELLCQKAEEAGHTHGEGCTETVQICELTDETHVHTESCYQTNILCQIPETEGHSHDNGCYEALQVCELAEEDAHFHEDACYEQIPVLGCMPEPTQVLICKEPVAQRHIHNESCFVTEPVPEEPLTCTLPEDENHTHSDRCYGTWELICGKEEHAHDLHCQSDPEADVETAKDWEATIANVTLTGDYRQDILAIATSQLGYRESTRNYQVLEDGETIKGYTRYGAWYGIPYGDWCAMFASFSVHYAQVEGMPVNASCRNWIEVLTELELYHTADGYTPQSGDLIFFDWEGDGISDHVGIVAEVIAATEEAAAKVKTIEGNTFKDDVGYREYLLDDADILGYSQLPEKRTVYSCGREEHAHEETCLDENGELICGMEEHTHSFFCTNPEAELYCWLTEHAHTEACLDEACRLDEHIHEPECYDEVLSLVVMIDTLPTSEEADEMLLALENTNDWDGYAAYLQKISELAWRLYYACEELSEDKLALVTNYDRLMDLEWLWSATTYAAPTKSPYYPMENGEWLTNVSEDNPFREYIHVNEAIPDEYTVDGLILGEKLTERCEPSFEPVFTSSLASLTDKECEALTGYPWHNMDSAGLDNTYGANLILPADSADHDAITDDKKTFVVYYNIGTYKGDQIDLLIQIVNYKTFKDDKGVVYDGILGFYSNGYIGVAVCGVEWVKLQYNFIEHKDIAAAVARAKKGEDLTGLRRTIKGSVSFFDIDYSQAIHMHGSTDTPWTEMLTGIYVTNVPSKNPKKQPDEPDLSYVEGLADNTAKRDYFRNWPANDCVLKVGTVNHAYSSWTGPAIFSPHPYDAADEDWVVDSKHAFTATFEHTWFYMNYSFNKGRNAEGGLRHFGEAVSRGSLTVKKEVEGVNLDPKKEYEFQITFYKEKSDGTYTPDTSLDGTFGGVSFKNGVGTFTLKNGKSITINNIPIRQHGTHYRVTELNHDGYIVNTSMSYQKTGENLVADGPYVADYYENEIQADSLMEQHQTVTFTNRHDSLFVAKELTNTGENALDMVGDPIFSFQIMKAEANGNRTNVPFFGDASAGAGRPYYVYDIATNELVGENPRYTKDYGIFEIKAGQRAEFRGISEYSGKYYIREVLTPTFYSQYEGIYVDGQKVTHVDEIFGGQYKGPVSTVKDFSSNHTTFTFENRVNTDKLSYLTITKMVAGTNDEAAKTLDFDMNVEFNGVLNSTNGWTPIPVGTPYTLYRTDVFMDTGARVEIENNPHRVVTQEGVVTVPGGATAQISYMLPGTTFRVSETSASAEGCAVKYEEYWGKAWITTYDDRVEGTIPIYDASNIKDDNVSHSCVVVINTLSANTVRIPASKTLSNGSADPDTTHTYSFTINLESAVNYATGQVYDVSYTDTKEVQVTGGNRANFNFVLTYTPADFPRSATTILTYSIKENKPDEDQSTHDTTAYTAVVVAARSWGASFSTAPYLYSLTKGEQTVTSADFVNTLLGDLSLEKIVKSADSAENEETFDFTVTIGKNATTPLKNTELKLIKNGVAAGTVNTDENGTVNFTGVRHGDKILLQGIPLGYVWRIAETNADGYIVSWTKTDGSGESNVAEGAIIPGGMEVVFTNTATYELPETGGMGTTLFYVFGGIMMLAAVVLLVTKKRIASAG